MNPRPEHGSSGRGRSDGGRGVAGSRDVRARGAAERRPRGGERPHASRHRDDHDQGDRVARVPEPPLPEHIRADQADRAVHRELRTLTKENAEGVARHLLAVAEALAAEDLDLALAHAQNAARRAGRVAIVRETLGFVHYRRAEWAKALAELRTAKRLSGSEHLLPLIADTERGLGRPERAIELASGPEARRLEQAELMELAVVVSGARRDLGQTRAAVQHLKEIVRSIPPDAPWAARVYYAYSDALADDGRHELAAQYLERAADADTESATDAAERLSGLAEDDLIDLDEGPDAATGEPPGPDADPDR